MDRDTRSDIMKKLLIVLASASFFYANAQAQNAGTVTNHAFVIGKGAGTTGYTSLLCGSAQLAVGQSAADPICQTITGDVTIDATGATAIGAGKVTPTMLNTATPINKGGTGQITAPLARASSGLNIDAFTGHGDSIYTILSTDRVVGTNAAFTASRTWTLPAANSVNAGQPLVVADFQGTVTASNTLVIARAGSDTVNGTTSVTISNANGAFVLWSDGVSKWTGQAIGTSAISGVSSVGGQTGAVGVASGIVMSGANLTLDQTWRGVVTSAQYGVRCDGDTTAGPTATEAANMQTFLTALGTAPYPLGIINGTSGGSVCYVGTKALNIPAKAVVYGGTRQTTIKWASATTSRMLQAAASPGSDSVTIKQLILDGTTKNAQIGIYPFKVSGWHLEDIQINNVSNCIYADAGAVASNYHVVLNVSCSSADSGISWVGISNSNAAYSFRCVTVTTCITDNGNNNSSTNGRFELVTTGTLVQATSSGYSSINDRVENTPTSGSGIVTASGAVKTTLINPYFAGLTTNINDAANSLINSPYEYRVKVAFNSAVAAQTSVDTLINTGVMANCKGDAEVTAAQDGGAANAGIVVTGMYRNGTGPYYRVSNITGGSITPNMNVVLTCRQRS